MWMIQIFSILVAMIATMEFISRPMYYVTKACKAMGFGFLVYHSDSQKTFYSMSKKDALEWLAATYADAVIFSNWSKEALAVKLAKA